MPVNRFDIADPLMISLSAVSVNGYPDALPGFLRIGISVEADLLFSQCPVKTLNPIYRPGMTEGDTPVDYP